eukprot:CAMPEP_0178405998 /NCGR_PEP_ID=MMETSP0689_2-20121128/18687_1 /TAXON_ID=160604 /ORGANISM="Amphidinium massartii, Strain CS-259" /LENGTH=551 /DNA_ID=CAMNT_0020027029 /DNA_START=171 /DNA_END=1822 /DNA_ORIENTATION=-
MLWRVRAVGSTAAAVTFGSTLCRCAADSTQFPNTSAAYTIPSSYGIGCKAHDEVSSPVERCLSDAPPEFCALEWCYLAANTPCELSNDISWSSLFPGMRYSYETCGAFNAFRTYDLESRLRGSTLKVVYLTNSGGWKGADCTEEICYGPVVRYLSTIFRQYQVNLEVLATFGSGDDYYVNLDNPPFSEEVMAAIAKERPGDIERGKVSGFNACVIATGLGYVDLCIATFLINTGRQQLTNMIHLISEPIVLVTAAKIEDPSFSDKLQAAFKPFTNELWLCVIGCIILLSVAMVLQEHGKDDLKDVPCWKMPLLGIFKGFESLFGGASTFHAHTCGGRITQLGLGFFILLIIASYTANLASLLVVSAGVSTEIASMSDAVKQGAKVCGDSNMLSKLQSMFPEAHRAGTFVSVANRSAALIEIGTSCDAAAVRLQDLQNQHSTGKFCNIIRVGDPLLYLGDGVPASARIYRSLQWAFTDSSNGGIDKELEVAVPADACGDADESGQEEEQSLTVDNMYGAFLVALLAAILGFVVDLPKMCSKESEVLRTFWSR